MSVIDNFYIKNTDSVFSKPSKKHSFLFLYFAICALIVVEVLPASWSNDAVTVLGIATGEIASEDAGSYYLTALVFGGLGDFSILLILLIGYVWSGEMARYITSKKSLIAIVACTTPGILMGMIRPQKDVFVGLVVFLVLLVYRKYSSSEKLLLTCWFVIYMSYGILMRPYFALIFGLFLLSVFVNKINKNWILLLCLLVMLGSLFLNQDQMLLLQGARDENNFFRGVDEEQRTAFGNLYPYINSIIEFWFNYIYAFVRLNFPISFYFDLQSIILQSIVVFYVYLMYRCFSGSILSIGKLGALLFFSHFIFLPLFEPDLGSYARHISLASAYLAPFVGYFFKGERNCESV